MSLLNFVAAAINIVAYAGFIVLGIYKSGEGQAMVTEDISVHMLAAVIYFVGIYTYAVLHTFMIFQQNESYGVVSPYWLKVFFSLITVVGIGCSVTYALTELHVYEWFGATLATLYVALFFFLFHKDPVDDELKQFFCCGSCCSNKKKNQKSTIKEQGSKGELQV
uniref:Uncharacterized protein n=2 Tax=Entomoneis paludosa TaxID=265537 RepID=A0A7S2YH19_9STRA|mmetsp:Transcript_32831/g.68444  ORF Transcript_32831/g.68444 Transcript_32831/m.68444 type:complete len:165 (+) Transcript_32831:95-589(+)